MITALHGRLLLVTRLLARDLRRRRAESVLLLFAIAAATATLTLGLSLGDLVADPFRQTRAAGGGASRSPAGCPRPC